MKKIKRIFIMLLCASMLWGCGKSESTTETVSESAPKDLRELNEECITVETGETEMDTETEGTVQLSVEFPDYKSLYLEANESEDPEEFVQKTLQQKKFKTCKTEITARVAVENGETVIYKEEAINQLLEKNLQMQSTHWRRSKGYEENTGCNVDHQYDSRNDDAEC